MQNLSYDVFCSGTAALPDGRALIAGGTSDYTFTGENRASIFDPKAGTFAQSQNMRDGRWYPMLYSHPYPYYYDSYRSHISSGGTVRSAPSSSYSHPSASSPSSSTPRGGFGSTG